MCIDNALAFIGSSNFDIRSFKLNFELNLIFYGTEIATDLTKLQNEYMEDSTILTHTQWQQRSAVKTTLQNIAKLLSPVL
jgi:cardiolipin synthase